MLAPCRPFQQPVLYFIIRSYGKRTITGFFQIIWDDKNDPHGNVEHIAKHGLTIEDVEGVLAAPTNEDVSKSSGLPVVWGYTADDTYIIVVYEQLDENIIRVITAYEVPEP